eukprot:TRINITY_DN4519_c0_g1_i1.p1 TRINITY_DN4519_c0_g1~~TRINITY_DN4519_c0_g1_i1.p1  ORF type:complete len:219 (-),score=31.05 TRINITY_DN4519_c0_g1_i1:283-939(-)
MASRICLSFSISPMCSCRTGLPIKNNSRNFPPLQQNNRSSFCTTSANATRISPLRCSAADSVGDASVRKEEEVFESKSQKETTFWKRWQLNTAETRAQVAKLGQAAILAYGLFDGITYTTFFILAFLGYEKSTGQNPASNIKALLGIVVLMWTGNNVTRPFRVAGAAALAPFVDKALKKIQDRCRFPNQLYAFALVVATFASLCLTIVGLLILSRWGR